MVTANGTLLKIVDMIISAVVVGPLVIAFWRGIWEFMNYNSKWFPPEWTLFISVTLHLAFILAQDATLGAPWHNSAGCHVVSRMYIYCGGLMIVTEWRSLWVLLDQKIGLDINLIVAMTTFSVSVLILMKAICNIIAAPYCIGVDHDTKAIYPYMTMFRTRVSTISIL
ncbi:hypothetical protein AAG570_003711 [Ranatra chinensis]|uniref:Uncharacterized protein n=1 Tax=Ranatra chinensis TaxID=642074 RepID=A0ABD0Y4E8_9HEMI